MRNTERLTRARRTVAQGWYWTKLKFTHRDSSAIRLTEPTTRQDITARLTRQTRRYLSFMLWQINARIKSCTMIRNSTAQSRRKKSFIENTSSATAPTIITNRPSTTALHLIQWVNWYFATLQALTITLDRHHTFALLKWIQILTANLLHILTIDTHMYAHWVMKLNSNAN